VGEIIVRMPDDTLEVVASLLTWGEDNPKLAKSDAAGLGFLTVGLALAPATISSTDLCPYSTPGCRRSCLFFSGQGGVFPQVRKRRLVKALALAQSPRAFAALLQRDLERAQSRAEDAGLLLACRLNLFSDAPWEKRLPELFDRFSAVQFYDYTKDPCRMGRFLAGAFPGNYHLTFSRSERNRLKCLRVLEAGGNVAVVFRHKPFPERWEGFPVVEGDAHDLRFLDPPGSVVGLSAKGAARQDASGFALRQPLPVIAPQ
jgi:hypothetical protein